MRLLLGVGLLALALMMLPIVPARHARSLLGMPSLLDGGLRLGVFIGGLRVIRGDSAQRAAEGAAFTAVSFTLLMACVAWLGLGFIFIFRRPYWELGRAWMKAGYSDSPRRAFWRSLTDWNRRQRLGKELRRLQKEWIVSRQEGTTAEEFLAARDVEIQATLASLKPGMPDASVDRRG